MAKLPTIPFGSPTGNRAWLDWFNRLDLYFGQGSFVDWNTDIVFNGSQISDIASRMHSALQSIAEANPASSNSVRDAHVSDNDMKLAQDHRSASDPHTGSAAHAAASNPHTGSAGEATAIADLNQTITNPPTQAEVQAISNKIDALLAVLRTSGALSS